MKDINFVPNQSYSWLGLGGKVIKLTLFMSNLEVVI